MAGEEVAQVYLINQEKSLKVAAKALKGFQRISLAPGESKVLKFNLTPEDLSYVDASGERKQLRGKLGISIGGSQPDESNPRSGNIVTRTITIK